MSAAIEAAVAAGDLDELLRWIDRLVEVGDWDGLVELRDRSRRAFEDTGRQLWPAASHAEYRLALEAPGPWAARAVVEGTGRFTLGPLPEVAASTHTWHELVDHLEPGPAATLVAHERVVRGEDLGGERGLDEGLLELPLTLQAWEPAYPLAAYEPDAAHFPAPPAPDLREVELPLPAPAVEDPDSTDALRALAEPWVAESNGRVDVVAVRGSAGAAIAALGLHAARCADVPPADAIAAMAWAGANGGAHGRRRGAAVGRFGAWWALAGLAGLLPDWPVAPDELGEAAADLRWVRWAPPGPTLGWSLHLAVEDRAEGIAWGISATDRASDPG